MKNKIIAVITIVAVVCIAWVVALNSSTSDGDRIDELVQQINANIEVKTYKNILPLYEELIELDPGNIEWYVGLADTYVKLEQMNNYKEQCERIVSVFPEEKEGHLMLIKYYAAMGEDSDVISIFNAASDEVKADEEFLSVYQESEWKYRFLSSGYSSIGTCTGGVYVIESNGVYGYIGKNISSQIEPKFIVARPFIEDYAAVYKDDEWYFIDREGDRVLATKEKLEDLYSLCESYAVARINGKYGYIDAAFNQYSFEYEDATSFYNGVAAVKKDGKWGLINRNFEEVTSFEYDDVVRDDANICSRKGIIFFLKDNVYHMLDMNGNKVTDEVFAGAKLFYSDYAAVKKGDAWGFIDVNGKTVIDFTYEEASSFGSGIAAVKRNGQWGCVDVSGKEILAFEYGDAMVTADNGVVVLKVGEVYRFVKFIKYE